MPCEPGLLESYAKDICSLVESFSEKDPAGKQSLIQLLTSDAPAFCAAGIRVLANAKASPGARLLIYLLTKEKLLTAGLLDPGTSTLKDATSAARVIDEMGSRIQPALEMALSRVLKNRPTPESAAQAMRILDLLGAIPTQNCWPAFQNELMAYPDSAVRSKAALLIGRNLRNVAWISRRLMDKDARVQANAVEALWAMDAADSRPVLMAALRSHNHRVMANAAVGLYRIADLKVVKTLLEMAQHADPVFRTAALWAIAETEDSRFTPFLMEQFKSSQGKMKLAVTRTLSRIRRHEKASAEKGSVQIRVSEAKVMPEGGRRVEFGLSLPSGEEISSMKPTEFALWEGGTLIQDYDVKLPNNPAAFVIGMVAPRFMSNPDPYGNAVEQSLKCGLSLKRPDDWWRVDRYATEAVARDPEAPVEKSTLPYDDALITQELKARKGFIADPVTLEKAVSAPVSRERATSDIMEAIQRQIDAMDKSSGKRHLFLFIHTSSVEALDDPENLKRLKPLIDKEGITLHGICPESSEKCTDFRKLCLSTPDGTFHGSSVDQVAAEFEQTYRHLLNRYWIGYSLPAKAEAAQVILQVCSEHGLGRVEFALA
jgi:hypothetical protein